MLCGPEATTTPLPRVLPQSHSTKQSIASTTRFGSEEEDEQFLDAQSDPMEFDFTPDDESRNVNRGSKNERKGEKNTLIYQSHSKNLSPRKSTTFNSGQSDPLPIGGGGGGLESKIAYTSEKITSGYLFSAINQRTGQPITVHEWAKAMSDETREGENVRTEFADTIRVSSYGHSELVHPKIHPMVTHFTTPENWVQRRLL
mmetsp:Transcript_16336/g.23720  ORF Transcript_16336/g.23720 Transcript_16336/m.23720 type:complete len:201 (-) Transcript_16336:5711-6313(-)